MKRIICPLTSLLMLFGVALAAPAAPDIEGTSISYYSGERRVDLVLALDEFIIVAPPGASRAATRASARDLLPQGHQLEEIAGLQKSARQLARLAQPLESKEALQALADRLAKAGLTLEPALYPPRATKRNRDTRQTLTNRLALRLRPPLSIEQIETRYGARTLRKVDYSPDTYILEIADGPLAALERARAIQENENVVFSVPLTTRRQPRRFLPNDPRFNEQWHLNNTAQNGGTAGADINVVAAWDTVKGTGVNIGVADEGMELTHPDLAAHIRTDIDIDLMDGDNDPSPESPDEAHGTMVGGTAAAVGDNNVGVSGVAPEASLVSIRMWGGDQQEADTMTHQMNDAVTANTIPVKNCSWGPYDDAHTLEGPGPLTLAALQNATTNGRGGLGSVFSWSAGNGGDNTDNVNYDGYASSRFTIAVGALNKYGTRAVYSEPGASLFISAPGGGNDNDFLTTDRSGSAGDSNGDYATVAGTSFSSPVVAGVVALMLETNPNLTWRDVNHILAQTAKKTDATNSGWFQNGAGFWFNHEYGFGAVDALAAVTAAAQWQTVPNEAAPIETATLNVSQAIPDNSQNGLTETTTIIGAAEDFKIEYVEIIFDATHAARGHIAVELTSPNGTTAKLAETHADTNADYSNWMFHSVAHWGENPNGDWSLRVSDGKQNSTGTWNDWKLKFHGYEDIQVEPGGPTGLDLAAADDSGASDSDNITLQTANLTISGVAIDNTTVRIKEGQTLLVSGTAQAFAAGLDITLTEGVHTIVATQTGADTIESPESAPLVLTIDQTTPQVTLSSVTPSPTADTHIPVLARFNEPVSGFDLSDIVATNAVAGNLSAIAGGRDYTFDLTPSSEGAVTAQIGQNAASDLAGNPCSASNLLERQYINLPGPTGLSATSGAFTHGVTITWNASTGATHYQLYRADSLAAQPAAISSWQTTTSYDDLSAEPGQHYYYWAKSASGANGEQASDFSDYDEGWAAIITAPERLYKITYKRCAIQNDLVTNGRITIKGGTKYSTVKIMVERRSISPGASRPGVEYLTLTTIPELLVEGEIKKITSEAPIRDITVPGLLKSLTMKRACAENISAHEARNIKITAKKNAKSTPTAYAPVSIQTQDGMAHMKITLTGAILTRLETGQIVKSIKVASKKYRDKTTGQMALSLGGVGTVSRVAAEAWGQDTFSTPGESTLIAFDLGTLSAKGCPIVPDALDLDAWKIKSRGAVYSTSAGTLVPLSNIRVRDFTSFWDVNTIQARGVKYNGQLLGGHIGYPEAPAQMTVRADNIRKIDGAAGVSGIFIAGHDGQNATYTGYIDKMFTKGVLAGEAHVAADFIQIKAAQANDFDIFTAGNGIAAP